MANDLNQLPDNLPIPEDDGACSHLIDVKIPSCTLIATTKKQIDIGSLKGWVVIFCYPMTGRPDKPLSDDWNHIPGARGCTPQACAFRDQYHQFEQRDIHVYGLSTQSTAEQSEAAERLHLPCPLLSDEQYLFTDALRLPTFTYQDKRLNKRVSLILLDGVIKHYFYPVFPPDKNVDNVMSWLRKHA